MSPSVTVKLVRQISCRRRISLRLRSSTARSNDPRRWIVIGSLYSGTSGAIAAWAQTLRCSAEIGTGVPRGRAVTLPIGATASPRNSFSSS